MGIVEKLELLKTDDGLTGESLSCGAGRFVITDGLIRELRIRITKVGKHRPMTGKRHGL